MRNITDMLVWEQLKKLGFIPSTNTRNDIIGAEFNDIKIIHFANKYNAPQFRIIGRYKNPYLQQSFTYDKGQTIEIFRTIIGIDKVVCYDEIMPNVLNLLS